MSYSEPTCPHCARPLPGGQPGSVCPFCQQALAAPPVAPPLALNANQTNWRKFFIILFIPAVGNFILMALNTGPVAILFSLMGCLWSGIVCSGMIMARVQAVGMKRQLLSLVIPLGLFALVFFLSFLGCAVGSNISNAHF